MPILLHKVIKVMVVEEAMVNRAMEADLNHQVVMATNLAIDLILINNKEATPRAPHVVEPTMKGQFSWAILGSTPRRKTLAAYSRTID
jgi:uncharacterized HAD superfamily protein